MLDSSVVVLFWSITRWVHPEPNARPTGHGLRVVHQRSKSFLESRKSSPTPQQVGPVCIRSQGKTGAHGRTNWQAARRGSSNLIQGGGAVFFLLIGGGVDKTHLAERNPSKLILPPSFMCEFPRKGLRESHGHSLLNLLPFVRLNYDHGQCPLLYFFANQECERTLSGWVEEWILESVKEA